MGRCPLEKSQKYKFYLAFENSLCKDVSQSPMFSIYSKSVSVTDLFNFVSQGYLTEKLWRTLQFPTVPVVLGGSGRWTYYCYRLPSRYEFPLTFIDYKRVAPDHSYINVFDFDGPKDLAEYLLYLDKNDVRNIKFMFNKIKFFTLVG